MKIKKLLKQYSKSDFSHHHDGEAETKIVVKILLEDTKVLAKYLSKDLTDVNSRETFLSIFLILNYYMGYVEYNDLIDNHKELLTALTVEGYLQ